jgi:hypothetical protein
MMIVVYVEWHNYTVFMLYVSMLSIGYLYSLDPARCLAKIFPIFYQVLFL